MKCWTACSPQMSHFHFTLHRFQNPFPLYSIAKHGVSKPKEKPRICLHLHNRSVHRRLYEMPALEISHTLRKTPFNRFCCPAWYFRATYLFACRYNAQASSDLHHSSCTVNHEWMRALHFRTSALLDLFLSSYPSGRAWIQYIYFY